jgi:hypothetical protein
MKWELYDPQTGESYSFLINPLSWNLNPLVKNMTNQPASHGSRQISFQGRNQPQTMTFSGTILEESEYSALQRWANKRNQVKLTDDLGRIMWIYIMRFSPQRQLSPNNPFYFSYSIEATILDWQ